MLTGPYVSVESLVQLSAESHAIRWRRNRLGALSGERISRQRGRGVDFEEVRPYQIGDDVRSIDWNVTARKNEPHTKIYTEEREKPTLIVVDQTSTMFFGTKYRLKSVAAAELAARFAWFTLKRKDRLGGIVLSNNGVSTTKPYRNRASVLKFLQDVAQANQSLRAHDGQQPTTNKSELWTDMVVQLRQIARHQHRIVLISDFRDTTLDSVREVLERSRHNELAFVLVFDELEQTLPPANLYSVTNGSNNVIFHSANPKTRQSYRRLFLERIKFLKTMCIEHSVPFTMIGTHESMDSFAQQ